jgi:hypothetical protein
MRIDPEIPLEVLIQYEPRSKAHFEALEQACRNIYLYPFFSSQVYILKFSENAAF